MGELSARESLTPLDVHVWWIDLEPPDELGEVLWQRLSEEECERARRFRFPEHRRRFVAARGALRSILADYLRLAPGEIRFAYGRRGKPSLTERGDSPLRFNLSHSGSLGVAAITQGREVGVDVERRRELKRPDAIARRFFSAEENRQLGALATESERDDAFFRCWTRKEAYLKALGDGLARPLGSFDVSLGDPPELLRVEDEEREPERWRMLSLSPPAGYTGALVVEAGDVRLSERTWVYGSGT